MPKVKIIQRPRADAPGYFRKAEQFCVAAAAALTAGRYDAAMLCAVHAGISSSDAICVGLGGRRSGDPDHMRAVDLLETIGANSPPIQEKAQLLRSLIQLKNRVEYEDKPATRVVTVTGSSHQHGAGHNAASKSSFTRRKYAKPAANRTIANAAL